MFYGTVKLRRRIMNGGYEVIKLEDRHLPALLYRAAGLMFDKGDSFVLQSVKGLSVNMRVSERNLPRSIRMEKTVKTIIRVGGKIINAAKTEEIARAIVRQSIYEGGWKVDTLAKRRLFEILTSTYHPRY